MRRVVERLEQSVHDGAIASASICVRVNGDEVLHHSVGAARLAPHRAVRDDQPYDLASVTKVLAGATVAASLVEQGMLKLDQPIEDILPDVDEGITLANLLHHTSGYPAWRPLYEQLDEAWGTAAARAEILRRARITPLEAMPGTRYQYSDIGFLVLLNAIESVTGKPLEQLFFERVLAPAGVRDLRWGWPLAAATEWPCQVREIGIEGTVHDLNCAAMGGVSTHAGLFGTARAVAALANALLDAARQRRASALPGRTLAQFWSACSVGSHHLGWDGVSTNGYTSTGSRFPLDAVGHLGYTGTSLWIAPRQRVVVALLTNRVHPVDEKSAIRALRPQVHDAIADALGWSDRP